jgi:hypothetical protein
MLVREYMPPVYQDWHNTAPVTMPCAPWESGKPFCGLKPPEVIAEKTNIGKARAERKGRILAHLSKGGAHTAREIAQALGMYGPDVAGALQSLCAEGLVVSRPGMLAGTCVNRYEVAP